MQSVRDILALWDGPAVLGAEVGIPADTVRKWTKFGRVPSHIWPALIEAAARKGVVLTAAQLLALSPPRKPRSKPRRVVSKSRSRKRAAAAEARP